MHKIILAAVAAALLCLFVEVLTAHAQHDWPIDPQTSQHPIGNSFGEFQEFAFDSKTQLYMHTGIDILGNPKFLADGKEDKSAPWVRVTVTGTVTSLTQDDSGGATQNGTIVQGTDGVDYWYWHMAKNSFHTDFVNANKNGTQVEPSDPVAKVHHWKECSYNHLHYELQSGGNYLDPLADITPNPDPDRPQINAIGLAADNSNPWSEFSPVAAGGCPVVSGNVDVVVQMRDVDDAGSTAAGADTLWVRDVRWRACPEANPGCAWQNTHAFSSMPLTWGPQLPIPANPAAGMYYSTRTPWDSDSDYCKATWLYAVVTNFVGGQPLTAGTWNTSSLTNGAYAVTVEGTDFAGNVRQFSTLACVQNGGTCTTELTIRDANNDSGAIPYTGDAWWVSPDITANPGTADQDINIRLGSANTIEVQIWNKGSCNVPAGTSYDVCLGWGLPSSAVAHPLPADQQIDCQTLTAPAGGWQVGSSQTATFTWTPSAKDVPQGHHCLVVWVDMTGDPVQNTSAVNWDDNRAQQNITFQAPPPPSAPGVANFWVNPQEGLEDRSLEIRFEWSGERPMLYQLRLIASANLQFDRVIGGNVASPTAAGDTVIEDIDPAMPVRLEGITVQEPAWLSLEGIADPDARQDDQFFVGHIVEYGRLPGQREIVPVGGLSLRFQTGLPVGGAQIWLACHPFDDEQVVQAFLMGVPWKDIAVSLYAGAGSPMAVYDCQVELLQLDAGESPFDPEQAQARLFEAGYPDGLAMTLLVPAGDEPLQVVASQMAEHLESIGIRADIAQVPGVELRQAWSVMQAAGEPGVAVVR